MLDASIVSYVVDKIHSLSPGLVYVVVALLVFGEAALFIGFVLPGETSVIVAGVVASQGRVNFVALCVLVVVAAILGDSVGYFVGQRWGSRLLEIQLLQRRRADVDSAIAGLQRRGPFYVFLGRFTAFLRAVMPGLAGLSRMQYRRFLVANASGAIIWGVAYSLLGYFAGNALTKIERYASWFGLTLLVVLVVVIVTIFFLRRRRELEHNHEAG